MIGSGFACLMQLNEHVLPPGTLGANDCCPEGPRISCLVSVRQSDGASGSSSLHMEM